MSPQLGVVEPFIPGSNFAAYEDRLNQWFIVNKVEEDQQTAYFITIMGASMYELLMSLTVPELPSKKTYSDLIKILRNYFAPTKNKRAERYRFNKCVQKEGEPIAEFIVRLKSLAQECKFGDFLGETKEVAKYKINALDEALIDRFIVGIQNDKIQQVLLNDEPENFEKCCCVALNLDMSQKESKFLQPMSTNAIRGEQLNRVGQTTNKTFSNRPQVSHQSRSKSRNHHGQQVKSPVKGMQCSRCRRYHDESTCPARNWTCFTCNRTGHITTVCRFRKDKSMKLINSVNIINDPAVVTIQIENQIIQMEVDTGACVSVMSKGEFNSKFKNCKLLDFTNSLITVSGQSLRAIGKAQLRVKFGTSPEKYLELIVLDSERSFNALLGRSWLDALVPNWRSIFCENKSIQNVSCDILNEIQSNFSNIVSDKPDQRIVGFMAEIHVQKDTIPIFHAAYSVPYKLREKVELELERLVNEKIIVPVKYSRWASPVVVVPKPNNKIRLCIDCRVTINKFIVTEHYPIPKIDDIFASLSNFANYFCVIDLKGAYQQLTVSEESREFLTINTIKGLFQYTKLPFGISNSPSIFQAVMDQILVNIKGVFCYLDDILVAGKTQEECKSTLFVVLERLNKHNVIINIDKCKFIEKSVKYLGHVLTEGGISPNKDKVKAIVDAPIPKNLQQLQSYLGLLNYYSRYIPNLSSELKYLYRLLQKDVKYLWDSNCQLSFEKTKDLLLNHVVLEYFDPDKPIIVAADASPYGVGAVLSNVVNGVERPVFFVSSTLSPAEVNYSQIHREALAIMFAVRKFHNYLYGQQQFIIYTDNKGISEIFNPNKKTPAVAAARLHRWAVELSMYNFKIMYRESSKMCHADALSRLPLSVPTDDTLINIKYFNFTNDSLVSQIDVQNSIISDPILSKVYKYTFNGWPSKIPQNLRPYFSEKSNLSTEDNCLYYGSRIVIPSCLKEKVLKNLHVNHLGIVRMKMIARSYCWWPSYNKHIEQYVQSCKVCQETQNFKHKSSISWPKCTFPFERVHIDFFDFAGKKFFVYVDAYSKLCEVVLMNSTVLVSVINTLTNIFSIYGLPTEIVSDNGPPFNAYKFKEFCISHGIKCTKSPSWNPQSNGQAENNVETVKRAFRRFCLGEEHLTIQERIVKFLISQRNTPSTVTGVSPSELIFAYKPKILLDILNKKPKVKFDLSKNKVHFEDCIDSNIDKKLNVKPEVNFKKRESKFKVEENVMYMNHFKHMIKWIPAKVIKIVSLVTYLIRVNDGFIRFVHEGQLRVSTLADKFHPSMSVSPSEISKENVDTKFSRKRKRSGSLSPVLRRSNRNRNLPDRLIYKKEFVQKVMKNNFF